MNSFIMSKMSTFKDSNWYEDSDGEDMFSPENIKKFKEKWDKETDLLFNIKPDEPKTESYITIPPPHPLIKRRFVKKNPIQK